MGFGRFLRPPVVPGARREREALHRHREVVKLFQYAYDHKAPDRLKCELAMYQSYVGLMVTIHQDCGNAMDWKAMAVAPEPSVVPPTQRREGEARQALAAHQPGLLSRLLGRAEKKDQLLRYALDEALRNDARENAQAATEYKKRSEAWALEKSTALGVLAKSPESYPKALELADPFIELREFRMRISYPTVAADVMTVDCVIEDLELVPNSFLEMMPSGYVNSTAIELDLYWGLHRKFACSCALRVAREVFNLLPLERVIVNIRDNKFDPETRVISYPIIFSVLFVRDLIVNVDFSDLDATYAVKAFDHRMTFNTTRGFKPVDGIEP